MPKLGYGKIKGSQFEREICKKLSLWISEGQRDDIFFRSASSGAMATQRFKKGKNTNGQQGDITSTDEEGIKFIKNFSIELKNYKDFSLDFLIYKNKSLIHNWWEQCKIDSERGGKKPLLIIKKNYKKEIIIFEYSLYRYLCNYLGELSDTKYVLGYINNMHIMILLLTDFFDYINPEIMKYEIT